MSATLRQTNTEPLTLRLDVEEVKGELAIQEPQSEAVDPSVDPELERLANEYADFLFSLDGQDFSGQDEAKTAVDQMGRNLQLESARRSQMLKQPVKALSEHGAEGGPVANALIDLKLKVEELDPARVDLEPGWFTRMLGWIPGVGTPLKRYFTKFESAQTVIDAIIRSLELGRDQLSRDNVTLREDQRAMRELTRSLDRQVELAQLLDQKLEHRLAREVGADSARRQFIQEELLFPLRQRTMDLQQQLAVNQQGVLATAIIVRNNIELVRGVNRALDVTVSALHVAVSVALALANQKMTLDKVDAINKTTSELIAGTAQRLKTQGTAIHTQASRAMLDMDALKQAFADIKIAMDEIARFRQEALPQMAHVILEFDELTSESEKTIEDLEAGDKAGGQLKLEAP